jgi:hypothetical protein
MAGTDLNAVKARIKEIEELLEGLHEELEELEVAEKALQRLAGHSAKEEKPLSPKETVETLILETLKRGKVAWMTVPQLQKVIGDLSGRNVPMSTLSPQVSYMTGPKKKLLVREGSHVALASRAEKEKYEDLPF